MIESEFKALFFSYGRLQKDYLRAKVLSQQEVIGSLKSLFEKSIYDIAIMTPQNVIWIKKNQSDERTLEALEPQEKQDTYLLNDYIVSTRYFKPWKWRIVILQNRSSIVKLIEQNNAIIAQNIAILIFLIILTLIIILYFTIECPFKVIFEHLNNIKDNLITPLKLSSSKEIVKLVSNINAMSARILNNQNALKAQKEKIKSIMDIQPNILVVTNGKKIQEVNASFFKFFDDYQNLHEFLEEHQCICDFFEEVDEYGYIYNFDNESWVDVVYNTTRLSKVQIKKASKLYIFKINVEKLEENIYVVNLTDITELEEYKEELETKQDSLISQLYTDTLTQLPNRKKLIEEIKTIKTPMITLINIDRFKEINDFYGVDIGDHVLREFAHIIDQNLPTPSSRLYKMSGDEYVILDDFYPKQTQLLTQLNRLSTYLNKQIIHIKGYNINISTTIGASLNTSDLLICADIALREAKNSKVRFAIYDKSFEIIKQYKNNLLWSKKIKDAVDNNRIVPYFQPIVDNKTHKIVKYESLVRLISSDNEVVSPYFFLNIAKQSHIYHSISKIMIEHSFAYFANKPMNFTINLSINDIENFETHQFIIAQLQHYKLGDRVTFEILESEGIKNYDTVASFIQEIKHYGATIAIDDFGTGYSNFNHIINLQIDFLKIDGSLINNMLYDENLRIVVETIVAFAKRLNIKTVAEFVDSKELYEYVCALGIDYSQGFYIAKPQEKILDKEYHFYP